MKNYELKIAWEPYQFEFQDNIEKKDYLESEEEEYRGMSAEDYPKIISTPFGMFAVDDSMNPFRLFEFWLGHTNFDITPQIRDIIKSIPGVETLIILTRYQFIIGVGKLFEMRDVRTNIEHLLCNKHINFYNIEQIKDDSVKKEVKEIENQLKKEYSDWAIYVFPNGKIDYIGTNNPDESYENKYNLFKESLDYSNGILISSNDA